MPPKRRHKNDLTKPVGCSLLSPMDIINMRKRLGYFQRDLAIALNVSLRWVQLWEAGSRSISHKHASELHRMHKRALESDIPPMRGYDPRRRLLGDVLL